MIIGFGNNVVSALAGDITTIQTAIPLMPGTGEKFAKLLSGDFENKSNPQRAYAKITLTDNKESAFEICHLISVSGDVLNVIRAQEGTTARGWKLNDVVANFATRGSENHFVQIAQLQSGHYFAGVAGGTANDLTLELPTAFFETGGTDWSLRTPLIIYPIQNNSGAATLQLTMGGRVLGTFPLYKGNKAELAANDIVADAPLVCVLDQKRTFFVVVNPGAMYTEFDSRYVKIAGDEMSGSLTVGGVISGRDCIEVANQTGVWLTMRETPCFLARNVVANNGASPVVRQEHQDRHFILGGMGNTQFGIYMINKSRTDNGTDGQAFLDNNGDWRCGRNSIAAGEVQAGNGSSRLASDGNVYGSIWGGWLSGYLQSRVGVQNVRLGSQVNIGRGGYAPSGHLLSGIDGGESVDWAMARPVQILVNGAWRNVDSL